MQGEIVEVWCRNDASNAVGVVNGESYCATCYPLAVSIAAGGQHDCGKGGWCPEFGPAFAAAQEAAARKEK